MGYMTHPGLSLFAGGPKVEIQTTNQGLPNHPCVFPEQNIRPRRMPNSSNLAPATTTEARGCRSKKNHTLLMTLQEGTEGFWKGTSRNTSLELSNVPHSEGLGSRATMHSRTNRRTARIYLASFPVQGLTLGTFLFQIDLCPSYPPPPKKKRREV